VDTTKLTKQLRDRLNNTPDDSLVEVVVEIYPGPSTPRIPGTSRQQAIAQGRQQFLQAVAPVEQRIQSLGGEVLEQAWLNQTLRVRLAARHVDQLTEPECVASVDTPGRLARE